MRLLSPAPEGLFGGGDSGPASIPRLNIAEIFYSAEGEERMLGPILADVRRNWASHVVVTGGEPMISPGIVVLTERLKGLDQHITVETAGTVYAPVTCDLMSISPKLANSTPHRRDGGRWAAQHDRLRYQPEVLKQLMAEYPYQLKFVVSAE